MKKQAEDIALVSQVILLGSEKAFRRLVEKYQSPIRRFFMNHTSGNLAVSDDLSQETFIRAWTHIGTFKGLSSFSTWLYRIAYNIWCDHLRTYKECQSLDQTEVDRNFQCEQQDMAIRYDLYRAMALLKEDEKSCILLYYMEDLSIGKISTITGMPAGTVKSHLSRAKNKLSEFLNAQGYEYAQRSSDQTILEIL